MLALFRFFFLSLRRDVSVIIERNGLNFCMKEEEKTFFFVPSNRPPTNTENIKTKRTRNKGSMGKSASKKKTCAHAHFIFVFFLLFEQMSEKKTDICIHMGKAYKTGHGQPFSSWRFSYNNLRASKG